MLQLIARRLAGSVLILFGVAAITFVLLYLLPADPAVILAGRSATAQTVANIRHELGLDQPLEKNQRHQPLPRCVGSRMSRKASPTRLKDRAVSRMTAPGMNTSQGAA